MKTRAISLPNSGFTLIEIVVAVAVLSVLMLVFVSSVDDFTPLTRARSGAREVAAAIRYAASEAGATGQTHWISYDLDRQKYWVVLPRTEEEISKYGRSAFSEEEDDTHRRYVIQHLPNDILFQDVYIGTERRETKGTLKFRVPYSGFIPGHTVHLAHRSDPEIQMTIQVNPITAETKVLEGYEKPMYSAYLGEAGG